MKDSKKNSLTLKIENHKLNQMKSHEIMGGWQIDLGFYKQEWSNKTQLKKFLNDPQSSNKRWWVNLSFNLSFLILNQSKNIKDQKTSQKSQKFMKKIKLKLLMRFCKVLQKDLLKIWKLNKVSSKQKQRKCKAHPLLFLQLVTQLSQNRNNQVRQSISQKTKMKTLQSFKLKNQKFEFLSKQWKKHLTIFKQQITQKVSPN